MPYYRWIAPLVPMAAFVISPPAAGEPVGRVTGIGGIFFKSDDPKALMAWYHDVLGLNIQAWGGAMLSYDAPDHPPVLTLNAFHRGADYMTPSKREFMLNFAVDDLDAMLRRLKAKRVPILKRDESDPSGKFAWIIDPDGTKIELWEPLKTDTK